MARTFMKCAAALLTGTISAGMGGCSTNATIVGGSELQQQPGAESAELTHLRAAMVRDQLKGRGISDERVLAAMLKVPRHVFIPTAYLGSAYDDTALPLALGQTVSQPYIVAFMTQALKLAGKERVLEIGTGSGYQAAVLAEVASQVYTVEILGQLSENAQKTLRTLSYENVHFRVGDGYQGWPEFAPFDAIIVTAAPDHVPQPLVDQLAPGGRMIIPIGKFEQDLVLIERSEKGITRRSTIPVRFVPMTGRALWEQPKP
jgi:protein-L-isoaspartate(D-aspartate) O-methyltransferase